MTCISPNTSTPRSLPLNLRIRAQSPLRKALPEFTEVLSTRQDLISLNNRIACLEERWAARLELHAIKHELYHEGVTVLRDEGLSDLRDPVKVASGDGAVWVWCRREEVVRVSVLLDQLL